MSAKPVAEILRELKKRYDKSPKGWRILAGMDSRGRLDWFISHGSFIWQIKMQKVKPYQYVGFGTEIGEADKEARSKFKEGRPMFFEVISPQKDGSLILATGVERFSTPATLDLRALISGKQRELEIKLSEELDRLLFKRYPEMLMYV